MKKTISASAAVLLAIVLSGCATPTKMAFQDDNQRLIENGKPIFLMTATIKNTFKERFQPRLLVVNVEKPNATQASDRINFTMDDKGRNETDSLETGNNYLLRMELEPGQYEIRGLTSLARAFPIQAMYFAPLHSALEAKEPGVYYLGHVNASVRERQGEEFKAGPSIPLIDQAVGGASTGSFDIEITDQQATDESLFRSKFPALSGVTIQKAILPSFDRPKAQQWWESH